MTWLVLQAAAITLVLTEASIFERLRTSGPRLWRELTSCSLCLGVWVGMGHYVLHSYAGWMYFTYWVQVLGFGCFTGALAYTVAAAWNWLDHRSGAEQDLRPIPVPPKVQNRVISGPPPPAIAAQMSELMRSNRLKKSAEKPQ